MNKIAMQTIAAPPTAEPAGWDDEGFEIGFVFRVNEYFEGEENPLNTLYADNRGRFFMAHTKNDRYTPLDMPWTAFHEISFEHALKWAIHASNNYVSSTGTMDELLEHALKLIGGA